jgi:hypothetical protein
VLATFTAVAADIAATAGELEPTRRVAAVLEALSRWQWFWGVDEGRLSEREALGLFGELWFLHRWTPCGEPEIAAWSASGGSRHDFQWPARSVEVKAARRRADGAVVHRIQSLDQLADPEQGRLFLFSLLVVGDELARNTLPDIVDLIADRLRDRPRARDEFARKLSERGFSPAHRHGYEAAYRVLSEDMYRVNGGFPRLTSDSFADPLPAGIGGVSYALDMAVCDAWRVATQPGDWPPAAGAGDAPWDV